MHDPDLYKWQVVGYFLIVLAIEVFVLSMALKVVYVLSKRFFK